MTSLEILISRYLDGELTAGEEVRLEHLMRTSPEARAMLREMTAIAHEARQVPSMSRPSQRTEANLFARLRAEGFGPAALPSAVNATPSRSAQFLARGRRLVPALLFVIAIAGSFLLSPELRTPEGVALRSARTPFPSHEAREPALAGLEPQSTSFAPSAAAIAATQRRPGSATHGRTELGVAQRAAAPSRASSAQSGTLTSIESESAHEAAVVNVPRPDAAPDLAIAIDDPALARGPQTEEPQVLPDVAPSETLRRPTRLSTSLRATASFIRMSDAVAKGITASVDLELGGGHRLGLLAGRAASITEQRATNTLAVAAQVLGDDKKNSRRLARAEQSPSPYSVRLQQEWWLGVEYQYRMARLGPVDLGVGVRAGIGQEAWRAGLEVPMRLRISNTVGVELSGSMMRVQPHSADRSASTIDSQADGYLYETQEARTSFTTIGAELGLRIALD